MKKHKILVNLYVIVVFLALSSNFIVSCIGELTPQSISENDLLNSRIELLERVSDMSTDGSTSVSFGKLSSNGYNYLFEVSEDSFFIQYKTKDSSWTKLISFSYDYATDIVTSGFQQVKSGYFYAASASFSAYDYVNVGSISYKDTTGGNYSSMSIGYAENFAEVAIPKINQKMMSEFGVSLCKIGFISYEHTHFGGESNCYSYAVCEVCGKSYGDLKEHTIEIRNQIYATCYEPGYTGDSVCSVCNKIIEYGNVIPVIERELATGKFNLLKQYILEHGKTDASYNKYIYYSNLIYDANNKPIKAYARITYMDEFAKFRLLYTSGEGEDLTSITMYLDENGSDTTKIEFAYEDLGLYADATIIVSDYKINSNILFEKSQDFVLSNDQIQNLCNSEMKSAFVTWDILLLEKLQLDMNMGNMGFIAYETPATHTWSNATCTSARTCKICGEIEVESIPTNNHPNATTDEGKAPTATEVGYTAGKYCPDCETWIEGHEEIPKLEAHVHSYTSTITTEPTCTTAGTTTYTCTCGYTYTETIPATNHPNATTDAGKAPTTTEVGYTAGKYCPDCETWLEGHTEIPKLEAHVHSYTSTITTEPTCTTAGTKTYTCSCGDTYTESIPATNHPNATTDPGKSPTETEIGYTAGKYCPDCETWIEGHEEIPMLHTHTYTSTVTKSATCSETGIKTYTCDCGDTYTEEIAKTPHKFESRIVKKASFGEHGSVGLFCGICNESMHGGDVIFGVDTPKLSTTKYTYDGKTKKPVVTVVDTYGDMLDEGTDYTLTYDTGRKNPGKYTVKVTLMGNYEGEKELEFSILPGKTTSVSATQSTDSIKLNWKKVTGADGYRVYQYNSKTGKYEKIKTLTGTSYTVKKLKAGTTYKFAVKAYSKADGETLWASSSKTIKTCTKPANPTVKATASGNKVTLKWSKVTGATGYVIYMQDEFGDYEKIGTTKNTSYTRKKLTKGETYYFRVRAYKTIDGKNIYGGYKTVKVKVK